jgi:hypothetical protein
MSWLSNIGVGATDSRLKAARIRHLGRLDLAFYQKHPVFGLLRLRICPPYLDPVEQILPGIYN